MKTFSDKVRDIVRKIPKGKTMTHKAVAAKAGNPKAARAVSAIMPNELRPIDSVSSRYCKRELNARLRSSAPSAGPTMIRLTGSFTAVSRNNVT